MVTKVFIDWPIYSPASNGIRCLYEISLELANKGVNVVGIPRDVKKHFNSIEQLPSQFRKIPITEKPCGSARDILIASETIPQRVISAARRNNVRIAWWQLAPYALLGNTHYPLPGDINMPFSAYTDPEANCFFYYQPSPEEEWKSAIYNISARTSARTTFAVYNGKGRLTRLHPSILTACEHAQIQLITRFNPKTKRELFTALTRCHGLISFDEITSLNLEATSLGLPVLLANPLFPPACRSRFNLQQFTENSTADPHHSLRMVEARISGNSRRIKERELTESNSATVELMLSIIKMSGNWEDFIVGSHDVERYRNYTGLLISKRVIYIHAGGQSGGSMFANAYCRSISQGRQPKRLLLSIRCSDGLYKYCGFILNSLKSVKMRIARKLGRPTTSEGLFFENGKALPSRKQSSPKPRQSLQT